ncbi:hypothetical protein Hanom_Chr07g00581551 [Helianthus anomalus]
MWQKVKVLLQWTVYVASQIFDDVDCLCRGYIDAFMKRRGVKLTNFLNRVANAVYFDNNYSPNILQRIPK